MLGKTCTELSYFLGELFFLLLGNDLFCSPKHLKSVMCINTLAFSCLEFAWYILF